MDNNVTFEVFGAPGTQILSCPLYLEYKPRRVGDWERAALEELETTQGRRILRSDVSFFKDVAPRVTTRQEAQKWVEEHPDELDTTGVVPLTFELEDLQAGELSRVHAIMYVRNPKEAVVRVFIDLPNYRRHRETIRVPVSEKPFVEDVLEYVWDKCIGSSDEAPGNKKRKSQLLLEDLQLCKFIQKEDADWLTKKAQFDSRMLVPAPLGTRALAATDDITARGDWIHYVARWVVNKRRPTPEGDVSGTFEELRKSQVAWMSPSTYATPEKLASARIAGGAHAIRDGRVSPEATWASDMYTEFNPNPAQDRAVAEYEKTPPIGLMHKAFAEFQYTIRNERFGATDILDDMDLDYLAEVRLFIALMMVEWKTEAERVRHATDCLKKLMPRLSGSCVDQNGFMYFNLEVKNSVEAAKCRPDAQMTSYIAHSHRAITGLESFAQRGWQTDISPNLQHRVNFFDYVKVPAIGMTLVGNDMKLYGVVWLGDQYYQVLLGGITLSFHDDCDQDLAVMLRAADELVEAIRLDIAHLMEATAGQAPRLKLRQIYPSSHGIFSLRIDEDNYLTFNILRPLRANAPYQHLYVAEAVEDRGQPPQQFVVKFAKTYSWELHKFCADAGHARKILAYEKFGTWHGVAMELLEDVQAIGTGGRTPSVGIIQNIQAFRKAMNKQWVHGDLRHGNILVRSTKGLSSAEGVDNFWIVDFDWGGKHGQASYPVARLNEDILAGRSSNKRTITVEDDIRMLGYTLSKVYLG